MISLPGYKIKEKIQENTKTVISRGLSEKDKKPVLIKSIKIKNSEARDINKLKNEYGITKNSNTECILNAISLQSVDDIPFLILEDFDGIPLRYIIDDETFDLIKFLRISIQISEALSSIHEKNIIHCNINPDNILVSKITGENESDPVRVKITGFGISRNRSVKAEQITPSLLFDIPLEYISPEQTGRINRPVDYRTDFYSFGITLYEMFTGSVPYKSDDELELIHCHIARKPDEPKDINHAIPEIISDIILKLISKNAEERYQSAYGLKADLEKSFNQLEKSGEIKPFTLGQKDRTDKLLIPQKLYGREREIDTLMKTYDRIRSGKSELMLVSGYAGIGKTALIEEIRYPIIRCGGYFISGKFDQFKRDIPFNAIIQAFMSLMRQLLTESEDKIQKWKQKIIEALSPNTQLIIDVIPELELITGRQEPVPKVGPAEARNRFNLYFQRFVNIFTNVEHPLVLFLDDLQWADSASLDLVRLIITDPDTENLCIIGAYRDNEVSSSHPLMLTIDEIEKETDAIETINLSPLKESDVNRIVSDTLGCGTRKTASLSGLVYRKTGGNPFFIREFIKTIHNKELLSFDQEKRWQWNIDEIGKLSVTDNVVDMLIDKIGRLHADIQKTIKIASCMGSKFDSGILSKASESSQKHTAMALLKLMNEDLIINEEKSLYKFAHDKIHEAAYSFLPEKEKMKLHYSIGKILLKQTENEELEDNIFHIVDQLNLAVDLLDEKEKIVLAGLNLMAGKKAKASTAYGPASSYLALGMELLDENSWRNQYELSYDLYFERSEIEYLNGNYENSESLVNTALKRARSAVEKAELYNILILQYTMETRYEEAVSAGKKALSLLDIHLPETELEKEFLSEHTKIQDFLKNREIESLVELPEMKIPEKKTVLKLLRNASISAYFADQVLIVIISNLKIVNISFEFGNTPESASGYFGYGMILGSALGDYQTGYRFMQLALKMCEKFNNPVYKCEICNKLNQGVLWVRHIKEVETTNTEGFKAGIESGELIYAGFIIHHKLIGMFFQGKNIDVIMKELPHAVNFHRRLKSKFMIQAESGFQVILLNLIGQTSNKLSFETSNLSEDKYLEKCKQIQSFTSLCEYYIFKSQVLYLYEKYDEALLNALESKKLLNYISYCFQVSEHNFYHSLILSAIYPEASKKKKQQYLEHIEENQRQMKIWADNCKENFLHKYLLVEAEVARITGKDIKAMDLYDRSIESARENDFTQNEAIANELAARFWLSKGKDEFAKLYMSKAHQCYRRWGTVRKVEDLEERYPNLLSKATESVEASGSAMLDIKTILNASQALSGEIKLDRLLHTIMENTLRNSGAQKAFLIMENDGKLFIQAEGRLDPAEFDHDLSIDVLQSIPVENSKDISLSIVSYVARTGKDIVLDNAALDELFKKDSYIIKNKPKSILCTNLSYHGKTAAIIYLENNIMAGVFTPDRLELLRLLSTHAAISIENARLYRNQEITLEKLRILDSVRNRLLRQYEESKFKIMQKRMNPHFLFNAINTIHSLIRKDVEKADNATIMLSEIYRFFMDKSFTSLISFEEEWKFMRNYLEFEKFRYPDALKFKMKKIGDFSDVSIPPLTIQPLAENSIKHGLRKKPGLGFVKIYAERKDDSVSVNVIDNGIGLKTEKLFDRTLGNIRDRLKYNFEKSDLCLVNRKAGGVNATISFQLKR